jgi:hypothetical protein
MKQIHGMDCLISWTGRSGFCPALMRWDSALKRHLRRSRERRDGGCLETAMKKYFTSEQDIMYDQP